MKTTRLEACGAFIYQWISDVMYVAVAALWLIPDRRTESELAQPPG
jgi:hypothetical protein